VIHPDHARWFYTEIQPHEPALRAYLRGRFPWLTDIDDLVQDAYMRLLRIEPGRIRHPKAFLFATAHHRAVNSSRRRRPVALDDLPEAEESRALDGAADIPDFVNERQELEILAEAVDALPPRCREVMTLRYREGLAYKEIAARLGISPETVKVQLVKGLRRCTEHFQERGLLPGP